MGDLITGPSGGVVGKNAGVVSREILEKHPDVARQIVTIGRYKRPGHDRERWKTVNWDDYRAKVSICQSSGPWKIEAIEARDDDVTSWVTEADGLPACPPGWYTALVHAERGLVMSDVPGEIASALPFLDAAEAIPRARVLIAGLGLGIVPARLLAHGDVARIDIVEIDPDVIKLTAGGCFDEWPANEWAADPRLHIWLGDAHTWQLPSLALHGCALHDGPCDGPLHDMYGKAFDAAWMDVWDTVSPFNLPSMHRLHRRFSRRVAPGRMWSWERPTCEAMRRRGQTVERPCFISDTGYWDDEPEEACDA